MPDKPRTDGLYTCTINRYDDTEYLRFFNDGQVIYGRARRSPEHVLRWLGRDENEHYDGIGAYFVDGTALAFNVRTDHTTLEHRGEIAGETLRLHLRWGRREADCEYAFLPVDFERARTLNRDELERSAGKGEEGELPAYLRERERAWWAFARRRGWLCRRCEKLIMIGERESYLGSGLCSTCATESANELFY